MLELFILAIGTLLPIVNPISTTFVFNQLTEGFDIKRRRRLAWTASLTAAVVLLAFLFIGPYLLSFFGITIYAFRVAGGLYLGKTAFDMMSPSMRKSSKPYAGDEVAIVPLGIPLLAGPGSMTAVLVLANDSSFLGFLVVASAVILTCLITWILLRYAHVNARILGKTGSQVAERVLGLLVLVMAAQFVFNGVSGYLATLP